tara:strand:+ start:973 stop:3150 length:2178 start_codon:yes stop_codon:yes gene_type:complete
MKMNPFPPAENGHEPLPPQAPARPLELSAQGWASPLAIFVSASLLLEAVTGLWIYLAPFSVSSQLQVVLHTLLGLVVTIPYLVYQWRHFRIWYQQNLTAVMVLGYALMAILIFCILSGLVLTWQAVFSFRTSKPWDLLHLVTGLGALALLVAHPALAFARRKAAVVHLLQYRAALHAFVRGHVVLLSISAISVAGIALAWPEQQIYLPIPKDYSLPDFTEKFDEYRGNPFAPTYARTDNGMLVNPEVLANSESCGTSRCHEQILAEWQPSAHRFSAMNPPFQAVQKAFAKDRSPAETRYCAGCHDPISLFAGAKDIQNMDLSAPGMQEGNSCVVCHSISKVDQRGNADYVLTPPEKYIGEASSGTGKLLSDFLIRAYPRKHLQDYDRNLLRTPEFCGACHKQFIPEALNRFGFSPSQNQFDEWRKSHWHVEDNPDKNLACRNCHMRLERDSLDPGRGEAGDTRRNADDKAHRNHGTIATNLYMPAVLKLPHWETQDKLTREWIQGKTIIPEIQDLWPEGPVATVSLHAPKQVEAGRELKFMAVVKNEKVGHNFITGPLDFMRVWVHLQVTDTQGSVLAEWGNLDPVTRAICDVSGQVHQPGNPRDEGTLVLEGLLLDAEGNPLVRHELWRKAGGEGQRVIFPKYSDKQTYRFKVPENVKGPLFIKADLNFRRYRQEFLDLVLPNLEEESGFHQPTVTKHSTQKTIATISNKRAHAGVIPKAEGGR